MHITVLTGTARVGSVSATMAPAIAQAITEAGGQVTVSSVVEHLSSVATVPPWGEGGADTVPTAWKELVAKTDAFVFILPEYNHSFPGEWKLLMDSLYKEYVGKHAFVVGVGGGQFAGARVMEHVMPVLVNFQFQIGTARLHVTASTFDQTTAAFDEATTERLARFAEAVTSAE